jgi:NAD(P)-dependent dehydrogenase (short-subunit alcohol dehydrogenase family)/uncharacterized lipoprotein YbaY
LQPAQRAVLITGASSGFGRAATELLASKGWFVYAGARSQGDLDALSKIRNVKAIRLDVTRPDEIYTAAALVRAEGRGLYGLVNNAGVGGAPAPLNDAEERDLTYVFDVNVYGPWRVTKAFAPLLAESKGRVVNISSIAGFAATPLLGPYAMSKHALEAYSDALRAEMAVLGVTVVAIEPGRFATNIASTATKRMDEQGKSLENSPYAELTRQTLERFSSAQVKEGPERVARAIEEALSSPAPKPRNLVVSDQRDAEFAIRRELQKVAQLNQAHPFSYDRSTLVTMLDEALANPGGKATMSKVTGTVSYRERIALPPAATIRVQLVDVSRADAPADVLGEQLIEAAGRQVPFAFEIPYDPARIDERMSYAVQARIEDGGRLLFISDQHYSVITQGAPTTVNLLLKSVGHSPR